MTQKRTIERSERIKLFLHNYYLGKNLYSIIIRITGGPITILLGLLFIQKTEKAAIVYGGFMLLYGIYYILKPFLFVILRYNTFKTTYLEIEITENSIKMKDSISNSEILFSGVQKILNRRFYFIVQLNQSQQVLLPFSILSEEQIKLLHNRIN